MAQRFPGGRGAWEGQAAGPTGLGPEPPVSHEPGGTLVRNLQTIAFDTFEYSFARFPDASVYTPSVSLARPVVFEIGTYAVPKGRTLLLTNYQFGLTGLSGLDPGAVGELPLDQFQGSVGFDLTVGGVRPSTLYYQLVPVPKPTRASSGEIGSVVIPSQVLSPAVAGALSLLPPRAARQGDPRQPFTEYVQEGQEVKVSAVIFRRISVPPTSIKASLQGYLISQQVSEALKRRLRFR